MDLSARHDGGYVIEQIESDILWLGHAKVAIRGDNEPAILRVVEKAAQTLRASGGVEREMRGISAVRPPGQRKGRRRSTIA